MGSLSCMGTCVGGGRGGVLLSFHWQVVSALGTGSVSGARPTARGNDGTNDLPDVGERVHALFSGRVPFLSCSEDSHNVVLTSLGLPRYGLCVSSSSRARERIPGPNFQGGRFFKLAYFKLALRH